MIIIDVVLIDCVAWAHTSGYLKPPTD